MNQRDAHSYCLSEIVESGDDVLLLPLLKMMKKAKTHLPKNASQYDYNTDVGDPTLTATMTHTPTVQFALSCVM